VFEGVERKGAIRWQEVGDLDNQAVMDSLAIGKELWDWNCASCHASDLRTDATGPALGNVTLFRDREWLYKFTANSQKMIKEGDSLALCLWYDWKPVVMNSFWVEGDADDPNSPIIRRVTPVHKVDLIYNFIENESLLQNIGLEEVSYTMSCTIPPRPIRTSFQDTSNWGLEEADSSDIPYLYSLSYNIAVSNLGWCNVDRYWNDPRAKDKEFFVKVAESEDDVEVGIIFPNDNVFIQSVDRDNDLHHFSKTPKNPIAHFPIGAPAVLIAKKYDGERAYFAHRKITYGDNEIETLELQEMTTEEVEATIRGLF
jgi:hypothetical protein